ncbi:MAG TPA: pantetheine-phosphate adenylyltransferase [Bacteroidales bacterium]|nr:pantetheine-phosphate adenylyltransferase [Bacteroidales bacterium]
MSRHAIFPGSFDPITKGHESIVLRAMPLFEKITIAVGANSEKHGFFPLEKRIEWIKKVFAAYPNIDVISYHGLTIDLCNKLNVRFILRGLRTSADFEFERTIGQMNKVMMPQIETVFMLTTPEHTSINSSIVREIIRKGGDASFFVPDQIDLQKL